MTIKILSVIAIGLGGGLVVGSGFVAFITVLGIIPRLTQVTKTGRFIHMYQLAVVAGAVLAGWISLVDQIIGMPSFVTFIIGLGAGIFVGMLAAALTEVLNVLPILAKRIGIDEKIVYIMMAIGLGKICGSLFHWLYFVDL